MKSLPFHIPEAWERYPFRAEPLRIGHHRKNPPRPPIPHVLNFNLFFLLLPGRTVWRSSQNVDGYGPFSWSCVLNYCFLCCFCCRSTFIPQFLVQKPSHYPLLSLRVYVKRAHSLLFMCRVSSHHMKMRISEFNFGCVISSLFWINSTVAQWVGLSCLWGKSPAEVLLWQVGRSRSHSLSFLLKIKGESYSRSFPLLLSNVLFRVTSLINTLYKGRLLVEVECSVFLIKRKTTTI